MEGLRKTLQESLEVLVKESIKEIEEQGHNASGRSLRSFEIKIVETFRGLVGQVLGAESLQYLDRRIKPHFPPVSALEKWAEHVKPGLPAAERKSFAWAVATNMAKEGMPATGAYRYTNNGRRINWTKFAQENATEGIQGVFEKSEWLERSLDNLLRKTTKAV